MSFITWDPATTAAFVGEAVLIFLLLLFFLFYCIRVAPRLAESERELDVRRLEEGSGVCRGRARLPRWRDTSYYEPRRVSPEIGGYREPPSTPNYYHPTGYGRDKSSWPSRPPYVTVDSLSQQPSETSALLDEKRNHGSVSDYLLSYTPVSTKQASLDTPLSLLAQPGKLGQLTFGRSTITGHSTPVSSHFTNEELIAAGIKRHDSFRTPIVPAWEAEHVIESFDE